MKSNVKYQWSRINWLWCLQRCSVFSKAVKAKQIISHQSNCIIYEVGIFLTFKNSPVNIWLQYMLCADVMLPLKYWMPVKRYVLISDWPAYFFFQQLCWTQNSPFIYHSTSRRLYHQYKQHREGLSFAFISKFRQYWKFCMKSLDKTRSWYGGPVGSTSTSQFHGPEISLGFLWVLWLTPTSQKHTGRWIGCTLNCP